MLDSKNGNNNSNNKKRYEMIQPGRFANDTYVGIRIYDITKISNLEIFHSELEILLEKSLNEKYNVYVIYSNSNNIQLFDQDFDYLKKVKTDKNTNVPENINIIKNLQKIDFFKIDKLRGLQYWLVSPKINNKNQYYFNIILCVDSKYKLNLNKFTNDSWNIINNVSIMKLDQINLNFSFVESFFNIKNNIFYNCYNNIYESELSLKKSNEREYNLENNLSYDPWTTYKDQWFDKLCFHGYFYEEEISKYLNYSTNFFELSNAIKTVNFDKNGELQVEVSPYFSHLSDLIFNDSENLPFNYIDFKNRLSIKKKNEFFKQWKLLLNDFVKNNINLYFVDTTIKNKFELDNYSINFLKTRTSKFIHMRLKENRFPDNIIELKNLQFYDLSFFETLQNLEFFMLLPYLTNNIYSYKLLIGFKNNVNFNLENLQIFSEKLNLINIASVNNINKKLSIKQIKLLFNNLNTIFLDSSFTDSERKAREGEENRNVYFKKLTYVLFFFNFNSYKVFLKSKLNITNFLQVFNFQDWIIR